MKKILLGANFKMNKTLTETRAWLAAAGPGLAAARGVEAAVAPAVPALGGLADFFVENPGIALAGQNCFFENSGAFTGEISPAFLADLGAKFVIVGHSERRAIFAETDEIVAKKVRVAVDAGLRVILCVGETATEKDRGESAAVVRRQISAGLAEISDLSRVEIAYEPVWAIGTGRAAEPGDAAAIHAEIRAALGDPGPRILYGGSASPENIADFLAAGPEIEGFLVGSAALDPAKFVKMAEVAGVARG